MVSKEEIASNDYDLSINKYKEIEYEPVAYDPPEEILVRINDLEKDIQEGLGALKSMLGDL
ncbi:hypothetical protein PEPNEM18_01298 [Aedoeadaptatus nemausensis]|uniref:Type I restriction-modification system methyltransferase subunit n=1 Tax=Aedoeadaptatus nemausensis TaxID=2582829 RepID=A0A6V6Y5Z4_9FIRM|nr:hypothetical protein [Peptoniphilus nemausensis]CAC9933832.1 hypothetical protein PEPNEM18_01298 [Peptoniphilus nemausensis]